MDNYQSKLPELILESSFNIFDLISLEEDFVKHKYGLNDDDLQILMKLKEVTLHYFAIKINKYK